ncbi:MAG: recombinase family protein [Clostridiaceae bacterium]|nr:recombinase family protein [Clostridiaceae bacterium]
MNIFEVQKLLIKGIRIQDIPMRVTFYARVSSEKDEQLNSLENQVSYYENLIKSTPKWEYVEGYIDEGISGKSTKKRVSFNKMISDGKNGLFDFVITKEISRFARNTVDSLNYTRELLDYGVGIYFESNNVNTFDQRSEFVLSLMSSIAQNELRVLSERVRFGHAQAIEKGVVLGNSRIFGYDKLKKHLVINPDEAPMVVELYELYATGDYSLKQLENIFWDKGYRNRNGNKIAHSTLANIIANPKYKGYYVGGKVKNLDLFSEKREFIPEEEWTMYKDETGEIVPAIVDEELWERANFILKKRSNDVKNRQGICNHANLLTGKIVCRNCGLPYYRKDSVDKSGNKNSKWICSGKIKNGKEYCNSFAIYEDEIKKVLYETFKDTTEDIERIIDEYTQMLWEIMKDDGLEKALERAEEQKDKLYKKKAKLLDLYVDEAFTEAEFKKLNASNSKEIEKVEAEIEDLKKQLESDAGFKDSIEEIKSSLISAAKVASEGLITKNFIDKYVDKIFVSVENDSHAKIEIKLVTGETTEKYLLKLKARQRAEIVDITAIQGSETCNCRTGHTSKKMIEAYENGIK